MKNKLLYFFIFFTLFLLAPKPTQAQHVLNGSFEINKIIKGGHQNFCYPNVPGCMVKYVEYIMADTIIYDNNGNAVIIGALFKDTLGFWVEPSGINRNLNIKTAPHGKTYLSIRNPYWSNTFNNKYPMQAIFTLSDSLTIGKRYVVRYYAGNTYLNSIHTDYLVVAAGNTNRRVGLVIDSLPNKDSRSGYREYVTSFVADSNYKYLYLYLINTYFQGPSHITIDNIRLDTCVQLANTQYIGCAQLPVLLKPTSISADSKYYWSTGDNTPTLYAQVPGSYRAYTYASNGCTNIDSFVVSLQPTVGNNTQSQFCNGKSLTLKPTATAAFYKWNTGDTTQNINITQGGTYWVTRGMVGCTVTDSFYITQLAMPSANNIDTFYCAKATLKIGNTDAQKYVWNTNDTTAQKTVNQAGKYWVIKTNGLCQNTDTFNITEKAVPEIKAVKDTIVCFEQVAQILLDAGQFKSYVWKPTNETSRIIYSKAPQVYLLQVTDSNNCQISKQIIVTNDCPEKVFIPNAFSPNSDGLNDVFTITTNTILTDFEMQIFNRWGILVFSTNNQLQGWDGKNATPDVYVVQITYKTKNKGEQMLNGNVTLLR